MLQVPSTKATEANEPNAVRATGTASPQPGHSTTRAALILAIVAAERAPNYLVRLSHWNLFIQVIFDGKEDSRPV